jgi:hypothetical protein
MFDRPDRVLVMVDGDLASVVAAANAKEAALAGVTAGKDTPGPVLWPAHDPGDETRRAACRRLASTLGLTLIERRSRSVGPEEGGWTSPTRILLDACTDAAAAGRSEVIWPVQFPVTAAAARELDAISQAVDRALLVTRLMALDAAEHTTPSLHVEVPMVDLTDAQVADLAVDLAAPAVCCWWWDATTQDALAARERWLPVLRSAGLSVESVVR